MLDTHNEYLHHEKSMVKIHYQDGAYRHKPEDMFMGGAGTVPLND